MDITGLLSQYSDAILFGILVIFLTVFIIVERKKGKVEVEKVLGNIIYIVMYKTTWGLDQMDRWAKKHKNFFKYLNPVIIWTGILGSILISVLLIQSLIDIFVKEQAVAGAALVLPFESSFTFYVPFPYWIISIFLIASVHEMAHGIIARYYSIKLKSTGFAFFGILLPIIPAAFVQPDEKDIVKRPAKEQLAVYAAGPFSNIVFGLIAILILLFVFNPFYNNVMDPGGIMIGDIAPGSGLENTTFNPSNEKFIGINDNETLTVEKFQEALSRGNPGDTITLHTNISSYDVILLEHPNNDTRPYLGVLGLGQVWDFKEDRMAWAPFVPTIDWLHGLIFFLFLLNIGIGLFNLLPLFIVDGGRMLYTILKDYFKMDEKKASSITGMVGLFFLAVLLGVLILPLTPIPEILRALFS
ncbi:MAG: site-2 protease family protein [Candidatus Woesearchaeota archaeon]